MQGTRRVVLVAYQGLQRYVRSALPEGTELSIQHCVDVFRTADAEILDSMTKTRLQVYAGTLVKNQALYVSSWFVTVEVIVNDEDVLGLRWTPLSELVTGSWMDVLTGLLPSDPTTVSAASQQALLVKIFQAVQKSCNAEDRARLSTKVKAEYLQALYDGLSSSSGGAARGAKREHASAPATAASVAKKQKVTQ